MQMLMITTISMKVYSFRSLKYLRCANVNDKWSVIDFEETIA